MIDTDKTLYIAKFPSRKDDYNTRLWEHFYHVLAQKAGIKSAFTMKIMVTKLGIANRKMDLFSVIFDNRIKE